MKDVPNGFDALRHQEYSVEQISGYYTGRPNGDMKSSTHNNRTGRFPGLDTLLIKLLLLVPLFLGLISFWFQGRFAFYLSPKQTTRALIVAFSEVYLERPRRLEILVGTTVSRQTEEFYNKNHILLMSTRIFDSKEYLRELERSS
ncbi:hypothetical protein CSKR_105605, partial [Clonorchis sinensis]